MRPLWIRIGPDPITGIRIRRDTDRGKKTHDVMKEGCSHKPRNTTDCQRTPEARRGKEGSFPRALQRECGPASILIQTSSLQSSEQNNFWVFLFIFFLTLNSISSNFCCFKPPVCDSMSRQPKEMNTYDVYAVQNFLWLWESYEFTFHLQLLDGSKNVTSCSLVTMADTSDGVTT